MQGEAFTNAFDFNAKAFQDLNELVFSGFFDEFNSVFFEFVISFGKFLDEYFFS